MSQLATGASALGFCVFRLEEVKLDYLVDNPEQKGIVQLMALKPKFQIWPFYHLTENERTKTQRDLPQSFALGKVKGLLVLPGTLEKDL